jgi:hypothetical protein
MNSTDNKLDSECFFGRHAFKAGFCTRPNCFVDQNNLIHITARRWFHKGPGNTYHSVTVVLPDGTTLRNPYEYGYGEQWKETALDLIQVHFSRHSKLDGERLHAFLSRIGYYCQAMVLDVDRKKDL